MTRDDLRARCKSARLSLELVGTGPVESTDLALLRTVQRELERTIDLVADHLTADCLREPTEETVDSTPYDWVLAQTYDQVSTDLARSPTDLVVDEWIADIDRRSP